ncbi:hypothetical protein HHX47_DHR1001222 [Lentinula edodes]|nr:hypothetical protein HHX47_DHR1001222 [Lentinula edodes]
MDSDHDTECPWTTYKKSWKKPLKGCLKSPSTSSSPMHSPGSDSPINHTDDTFASFAQACADLQTLRLQPSELNLAIPGSTSSNSSSGSSSPTSNNYESSGTSSPVTDGSLTPRTRARKNVSFCSEEDGLEEVFIADVWDRTPTEPAGHLSYQELLELKAIQRTLPRAQQLPDMFTGRPAHHYLQHVPISLLPLTDQSSPSLSPLSTPHSTPVSTPGGSPIGQGSPSGSADRSPPRSPVCGPSPKSASSAHGAWHSYTPSTMSPLTASALAAAFASKNAEKRVYPANPIPSNLGPKFVPPTNPPVTVARNNTPTPSSPTVDSPSTPKPSLTPTATSSPVPFTAPAILSPSPSDPFSLSHLLPSKTPTPMRRKPNFAFLPLLDTPPSSGDITPTTMIPELDLKPSEQNKSVSSLLASPIVFNESSPCDDEPPSIEAYSSSSSSYTSDSERESGLFYTDGSPLSRSTSITSVSTSGSVSAEVPVIGSAYTETNDSGNLGFFLIPPSKRAQLSKPMACNGNNVAFSIKDPRLQAVTSPVLAPPSPFILDGAGPTGARSLDTDLAAMQERLERVELERSLAKDVLEDTEPITRTPLSSSPLSNSQTDSSSVSGAASPDAECGQEHADKTTDWEEVERFRRERLGNKWTPPSSRGPSRTSSRAPSRERNVVEINGVEIELDD